MTHLIDGEFQSDKYPTCPPGKVPLSTNDKTAQDLLWEYAQRRRVVDPEFSADLETALRAKGYVPRSSNASTDDDPYPYPEPRCGTVRNDGQRCRRPKGHDQVVGCVFNERRSGSGSNDDGMLMKLRWLRDTVRVDIERMFARAQKEKDGREVTPMPDDDDDDDDVQACSDPSMVMSDEEAAQMPSAAPCPKRSNAARCLNGGAGRCTFCRRELLTVAVPSSGNAEPNTPVMFDGVTYPNMEAALAVVAVGRERCLADDMRAEEARPPLTHVALRFEGKVWSLPKPYRHHDIIGMIWRLDPTVDTVDAYGDNQGFLDASGRYLTRPQAEVSAFANNQVKNGKLIGGPLSSEDLW